MSAYVVITPVYNERATLGATIKSVVSQTRRPCRWVIVDGGSTDGTTEVIAQAASEHPWIVPETRPAPQCRNFAEVVHSIEHGYARLQALEFDFVGILDGDVLLPERYYEELLKRFDNLPRLGLAGGIVIDVGEAVHSSPWNTEDVPGAVQFFRRRCFEAIQPLVAVPEGGWDAYTCICARMHGWHTRLFSDLKVEHLKPRSAYVGGRLKRAWSFGIRDWVLGYSMVYELLKCGRLAFLERDKRVAFLWFAGFLYAAASRRRAVPRALAQYARKEQWQRIMYLLGLRSKR